MNLLDYKIAYILSKESEIFNKIYSRLITKLSIDGKADMKSITVIKAVMGLLGTSILTYNLKLELYKKLLHLLRILGLIFRIPDAMDAIQTNPVIYWGAGDAAMSVPDIQNNLIKDYTLFTTSIYFTYTLTEQVYYIAYPTSKGDLVSILDNNGYPTLGDWIKREESFNFSPLPNVAYNVYELSGITTQTSFTNTFILP